MPANRKVIHKMPGAISLGAGEPGTVEKEKTVKTRKEKTERVTTISLPRNSRRRSFLKMA
jgi:hypothetical protein